MNVSFSRMLSACLIFVSVFLVGCAGSLKQLPDGSYLGVVTAGDSLDRSASHIGIYEAKVGPDGKPLLKADGTPVLVLKEKGQLSVGTTIAGQALVGATSGTVAAIIQAEGLKDATKLGKCADGANCGTVNNVVANSGSAAQSNTSVSSSVNAGAMAPCTSSKCTGR